MYIKAITTDEEFDAVKNEWIDFEKKVDNKNIHSSYLWQRTWWKHFGHINNDQNQYDKKLSILFLYVDEDELRAIAPFCVVKRKFKKIFHYTSVEFIAQQWRGVSYLDFIASDLSKNEFDYLFHWLQKNIKFDLIYLAYIPESTSNFNLESENASIFYVCPEIEGESYSDVWGKYYSKRLKRKLDRIHNKIIRGNADINYTIVNGENILNYFNKILPIAESKNISGKYLIYKDPKKAFVEDLIFNFSGDANCILLFHNKTPCAYNLGYYYDKKYFADDTSYNRGMIESQNYSPGIITMDKIIEITFSKGINEFCFGEGADRYKTEFSKKICKTYNIIYRGNTLISEPVYQKRFKTCKQHENNILKELNEKKLLGN